MFFTKVTLFGVEFRAYLRLQVRVVIVGANRDFETDASIGFGWIRSVDRGSGGSVIVANVPMRLSRDDFSSPWDRARPTARLVGPVWLGQDAGRDIDLPVEGG